jgi:hypothetical protein
MRSGCKVFTSWGCIQEESTQVACLVEVAIRFYKGWRMTRIYALHKLYAALHKASRDERRCSIMLFYIFSFLVLFLGSIKYYQLILINNAGPNLVYGIHGFVGDRGRSSV